jgi:hypothetical protein
MKYTIETAGPVLMGVVTPTMEALGDQPWIVRLYEGGALIVHRFIEASSGLEAVTAAAEDWLEEKGIDGTIKIS